MAALKELTFIDTNFTVVFTSSLSTDPTFAKAGENLAPSSTDYIIGKFEVFLQFLGHGVT